MTLVPVRNAVLGLLALTGLFAGLGCGSSSSTLPQTYPVTGTVKYQGDGPAVGAAVQFATMEPSIAVSGEVGPDGAFTLFTVKGSERISGAPAGRYMVSVQPPIGADHRPVAAITLPDTYFVEQKENQFAIEIGKPVERK
jgi:hypothetical protein